MRKLLIVVLLLAATISLTGFGGCGAHDVNIGGRVHINNRVIDMPDHFSSIAITDCYLGYRFIENDHGHSGNGGGSVFAIPCTPPTGR